MKNLEGKTAFVTGGAVGMGLGMTKAFAEAGMNVVVCDIRQEALDDVDELFASSGHSIHTIQLDVTDRNAWDGAADEAERKFGKIHLLCHNVGGGDFGYLVDSSHDDWDWLIELNLRAPIAAIHTILPRIRRHGEGGHIVVTASIAGILPSRIGGVYSVAKAAVVGLMESLRGELDGSNIGVSVLCPGLTKSSGATTSLRPAKYAGTGYTYEPPQRTSAPFDSATPLASLMSTAMTGDEVGRRVLKGVLDDDLYILTHPEFGEMVREKFDSILAASPPPRQPPAVTNPPEGASRELPVTFGAMYKR